MVLKINTNSGFFMSQPEKQLENDILDWLNSIPKCFAWKHYNGASVGMKRPNTRHRPKGLPDIMGLYKGRFFAIEVKFGKAKPSELQLHIIQKILGCEGVAFWTNDIKHCKRLFCFHFSDGSIKDNAAIFETNRIPGETPLFED